MLGGFRGFRASGRLLLLAPALLLLTLVAWAIASPVGSSPDEDYHLTSIWCATGDPDSCVHEPGTGEALVPGALVGASCYAFDPEISGDCQRGLDFAGTADEVTERGNYYGAYPPGFHGAMSLFVGDDIQASVVTMRIVLAVVFTLLATLLFALLPPVRRPTLVWSWVVTTVPVGLFMLTAVNPSAWAFAGVGFGWLALAGFLESHGARKVGLGLVFGLSVLMAAGSRGDAASYMVLAILAVLVLQGRRSRRFALDSLLPAAGIVVCLLLFRVSRPVADVAEGVDPGDTIGALLGRAFVTMLEVPALWAGVFGRGWGLGWLDTAMPSIVWAAGLACFVGLGAVVAARADLRKALVLAGGFLVLLAFPAVVLVTAGDPVGTNLQPRYLLPLVVLFAGVLFWAPAGRELSIGRGQRILAIGALAIAQAVALRLHLARYVSGFDDLSANLDAGIEWWWDVPFSPTAVWIVGSLAYTALLVVLLGRPLLGPAARPALADREEAR